MLCNVYGCYYGNIFKKNFVEQINLCSNMKLPYA